MTGFSTFFWVLSSESCGVFIGILRLKMWDGIGFFYLFYRFRVDKPMTVKEKTELIFNLEC